MDATRLRVVVAILMLVLASPAFAQTTTGQDDDVSRAQVERLRAETERDLTLADDLRTRTLELYDVAISSLEKAADFDAAAVGFEGERSGIDRIVANLRAQLDQPERQPRLPLPENPTVAQAEDALTRERARLAANRTALRNQERLAEDRAKTRSDISQRLGELDLELELLNDKLRQQAESAVRTELRIAARQAVLARREAALSEIDMHRARLALLNDRSSLIPLQTDLLQRRVSFSQELVSMLEEATHDLRVEDARKSLAMIQEQSRALSDQLPSLAPMATETRPWRWRIKRSTCLATRPTFTHCAVTCDWLPANTIWR